MTSSDAVAAPALGASGAMPRLRGRTLVAAAAGIWVAQLVMAEPAVLNCLFQSDFGPTSAQLTWLTAVFLLPVTLLELTFGVLGDLFGRKRLLVGGAALMVIGLLIAVLSPGAGTATGTRLAIVWTGQAICGLGAAAIIPTSLAMVAAGTHTAAERSRGLTVWSVALVTGGLVAPVLGGWLAQYTFGSDPHSGWRWAFAACMVFAVISGLLSLRADDSRDPVGRSLDWPGQLTIALALLGLLLAVIQGPTSGWGSALVVVLYPVTRRALATVNPRWVLGAGLALIAVGDFWLTAVPITDVSVAPVIVPLIIAGSGFALAVSSVAAVTVNTVPRHMIGMASGANSMIRDLGFALAPAVLGAVALSRAANAISSAVAKDPALGSAVAAFYASPEHAPAAQRQTLEAAVGAVKSGPLGANGVPASVPGPGGAPIPLNPLHETAFHALGSAYSVAYLIAGLTALAAALITITLIGGRAHDTGIEEESLA